MISIASNFASQTTINQINSSNNALTSSMERLSTGNRINSAADDAAGLQIANRLSTQSRGMSVAMRNSQDATSLLQTAEGSLEELGNIGARMNDLATQAANGTNSQSDLDALNGEYQALGKEMANILENTNFGGQKLLAGSGLSQQEGTKTQADLDTESTEANDALTAAQDALTADDGLDDDITAGLIADLDAAQETANSAISAAKIGPTEAGMKFQTGSTTNETLNVAMDMSGISSFVSSIGDLSSADNAQAAMKALGGSAAVPETSVGAGDAVPATGGFLQDVTAQRSNLGANINRIEHNIANMTQMKENLDASTGRIMDTDFASESGEMTKQQMLVQTGAKMLSTTKMVPQLAMSMLG
ncbi:MULTISPECIES: flagellin N-terminal helical domain-containing protein [Vibrio]|uniref:flagellin N-terminal helical domain-containing protein n=1 Tax=Vibrio TaxID=662 RepID=UPI000B5C56F2|nr:MULTISPECIES: flagellin [Vibrio]HBV76806.1 Lateral flagellin [Vibrio sp.]